MPADGVHVKHQSRAAIHALLLIVQLDTKLVCPLGTRSCGRHISSMLYYGLWFDANNVVHWQMPAQPNFQKQAEMEANTSRGYISSNLLEPNLHLAHICPIIISSSFAHA